MERDKAKPSTIKLPETNRSSFSSKTSVKTPKEKNTKEEIDVSQLSNSLIKTETISTAPSVGTPNTSKSVENKLPLQTVPNVTVLESCKNETSNDKILASNPQETPIVTPQTNVPSSAGRLGSNTPSNATNAAATYSFQSPTPNITASPSASVSSARFSKKKENPPASPNASIPKDNPRSIKTSGSPKAVLKSKLDKQEKPKKMLSPHMSLDSPEKDGSVKTNLLNTSHDIDGDSLGHSAVSQPSAKQSTNEFVNYYKQERPKINIWTYLFKNLNNSISQIYTMCDLESSVEFNNGVVSTLEAAIEDIKKLNKKIELDNMTDTKPIAWEVPNIANEIQNKQEIENFLEDVENPDTVDFTLLTQLIQDGKMSRQDALVLLVRERALLLDDSTLNLMNNSQGLMSDNISVVSKINPDFSLEYHKDSKDNKDGKEESIGTPFHIIDEGQDLLRRSRSQTPGRISLVKVINRLNWKLQDKKKEADEGYASEEYLTEEHKNKLTEKQQRAEMNRKERENIKQDSLQREFHKINEAREKVAEKVAQQHEKNVETISKKIKAAEERYEARLTEKKKKAKNEIDKVNEVAFISFLEKQNKKLTFDQKLQETRERRLNILEQIKQKQMGRSIKEDAASKKRAALQKETEGKLKSKLEEAEHRRNKIFEDKKKVLGEESKKLVDVTNRKKILGFKETPLKKGEEQTFKARIEHLKIILLEEQQKLNKRLAKKDNKDFELVKRGRKLSVAALSSEEEDTSYTRPKRVRSVRSEDADDDDGDITLGAHSILFYEPRSKRKEKAQEEENKAIAASKEKAAALKKDKKKKKKKKEVDIAPKKDDDDKMKTVYVLIRSFSQPNLRTPKLRDLQLKLETSEEKALEEKKAVQKGQKVTTPSNSSAVKKLEKVEPAAKTTKDNKEKEKDTKGVKHDGETGTAKKFSINKAKSIGSSSSSEITHATTPTAEGGRSGRGPASSQTSVTGRKERTSVTEKDEHSLDLDSSSPSIISGRDKDKEKEKDAAYGSMLLEKIHEQSDNDENLGQTNSMSDEKDITEEGKDDVDTSTENDKKVRWCSICDLILEGNAGNDEHIGSKQHRKVKLQYNLSSSDDTNCILEFRTSDLGSKLKTERWNTLKKRCKKIKQRLVTRALKKENSILAGKEVTSINKQRLQKLSQDLDKQVATQIKDYDVVDNTLKDILKLLENQKEADLHIMRQLKFIPILMEICKRVSVCHKNEMDALLRALDSAIKILAKFCGLIDNRTYMILSNRLVPLVDLLIWCLNRPTKFVYSLTFVPHLFTILGRHLNHRLHIENAGFKEDIIEYIFCSGLIMKLQQKFMSFNGGLDLTTSMGKVPLALLKSVSFLEILTNVVDVDFNTDRGIFDPTIVSENIMIALKETEFVGMFTLLASLLLSDGSYIKQPSKVLPQTVLSVAMTTVKFFNNIARIMLEPFQSLLGNKEHQEQVCHVFGYLLIYCNHHYDSSEDVKDLLDELILMIGYFCVLNPINQEILGKGMSPIIQKLTALPIPYFTDKRMKDVLFPTLFCAVFQNERNLGIVDQEASKDYLEKYLQSQIQLFPLECINEKEEGHLTPSNQDSGFGLNPFGIQNRSNKPKEMKYIRALSVSSNTSSTTSLFNVNASNSYNFHLICRFPRNRWDELLQFIHSF